MSEIIQIRRDTAINWHNNNPKLAEGEMGYETNTHKFKFGDGTNYWNDLSYVFEVSTGESFGTVVADFGTGVGTDKVEINVTGQLSILATALGTGQVAGLGGYQRFANAAGLSFTAATSWFVYSFLIPVPTVAQAKGLMLCGIDINVCSRVATGTNAAVIPFTTELGFGCNAVDPATAEAITTQTSPIKGVRKQIIGFGSWAINTPIGTAAPVMSWRPQTPVYCEAGTYVQIYYRPAVTHVLANTQELLFADGIEGYWL